MNWTIRLLFIPAIMVVVVIRLLKPLVTIRIGEIEGCRIGQLAYNVDKYLYKRNCGVYGKGKFDVFYFKYPVCNYQFKRMVERVMRVIPCSTFMEIVYSINHRLPGYGAYEIVERPGDSVEAIRGI